MALRSWPGFLSFMAQAMYQSSLPRLEASRLCGIACEGGGTYQRYGQFVSAFYLDMTLQKSTLNDHLSCIVFLILSVIAKLSILAFSQLLWQCFNMA